MTAIEAIARAIYPTAFDSNMNWNPPVLGKIAKDTAMRKGVAALLALKDYPPVFGNISKRKGSLADMYIEDRRAWSEAIDNLLREQP